MLDTSTKIAGWETNQSDLIITRKQDKFSKILQKIKRYPARGVLKN